MKVYWWCSVDYAHSLPRQALATIYQGTSKKPPLPLVSVFIVNRFDSLFFTFSYKILGGSWCVIYYSIEKDECVQLSASSLRGKKMNSIRRTEALNKRELENCTPVEASWHKDYEDTAFIYIGGLDERLTEGDIITIFSQYGEPVYLNLVRDKETGKSKGFAFLKYEDQRSCDLAVDNLGGAKVMERFLRVDHTRYKKRDDEDLSDNTRAFVAKPTEGSKNHGREDGGDENTDKESDESEAERPLLKEEIELQKLLDMDDEDPMKATLIDQKRVEADAARRKAKSKRKHKSDKRHHRHSHHSSSRKSKSSTHEHRNRISPHRSGSPGRRRNS